MPRAIWTGAISFGLVTVPVKMYSAVNRKTVRFHQLSGKTGARVAQKRVDPQNGDEVPYEAIVKGYELAPDRYVVIEPAELDTLQPEKTKTIEIEDFVELTQIDPIYYDHPYYLAPGPGGAKPYPNGLPAPSRRSRPRHRFPYGLSTWRNSNVCRLNSHSITPMRPSRLFRMWSRASVSSPASFCTNGRST